MSFCPSILYRDLKPENVGFDVRGDLKLFDFGLARQLPSKSSKDYQSDGLYLMTGLTGSRRYMAPEVVLSKPYNLSADVYSFAILAWEMFSFRRPFSGMDPRMHEIMVAKNGIRPDISKEKVNGCPTTVIDIMVKCWDDYVHQRPSIEKVSGMLRNTLDHLEYGFEKGKGCTKLSRSQTLLQRSENSVCER